MNSYCKGLKQGLVYSPTAEIKPSKTNNDGGMGNIKTTIWTGNSIEGFDHAIEIREEARLGIEDAKRIGVCLASNQNELYECWQLTLESVCQSSNLNFTE